MASVDETRNHTQSSHINHRAIFLDFPWLALCLLIKIKCSAGGKGKGKIV